MSLSDKQRELATAAKALLEEAYKVPPAERFARRVREGLIDRHGRLTRLFGGEAEPEPEALAAQRGDDSR